MPQNPQSEEILRSLTIKANSPRYLEGQFPGAVPLICMKMRYQSEENISLEKRRALEDMVHP